jgi:catechol 2,3-dioxygenase-like lactoylglutathione lyase family enzyme
MDDFGQLAEEARGGTLRRDDFLKRAAALGVGAGGAFALLAATGKAHAAQFPDRPGETGQPNKGLRAHVNRFSHLVINVSDLERSREFYETTYPLKAVARTNGPAQAYPSLGLKRGQFDGYMLRDSQAYPSRAIHIVEWKDPKPVGKPYETFVHVGIYRTSALTPDIQASYQQVLAAGGVPWGPPSNIIVTPEGDGVISFGFKDPDGSTLQYLEDRTLVGSAVTFHENINCQSLRRSFPLYQDVLGLDYIFRRVAREPQPATVGALGQGVVGDIFFDAPFFGHRADQRNPVDLLEWSIPKPVGRPYRSPFNLGMMRLALEVDDIHKAWEKLVELGLKGVSQPEEWDMGEFGTRKVVIFRDPDGVFLELIERPPYASELAPPFTAPF